MKKLALLLTTSFLLSSAFAFFDFYAPPMIGMNHYEDDDGYGGDPEQYMQEPMERKVYLPSKDKIYRDQNGRYIMVENIPPRQNKKGNYRRRKHRNDGGGGGLHLGYMPLSTTQFAALNTQAAADSVELFTNKNMVFIGGGGYWHASKNLYIGGAGKGGFLSTGKGSDRASLGIGYGGVDFNILIPIGIPEFNVVAGALFGAGGLSFESKTNTYSKAFWVLEPKAGVQINFSKHFAMRGLVTLFMTQDIEVETTGTLDSSIDFDSDLTFNNLTATIQFEWGLF
jgi:hypothetical protein